MSNNVKITSSHRVLMVALLAAAFACYLLVEPYINSIVMAFIISLLMFPIHEWFEKKMPKHRNMASLLSCVVLTFIIVIPLLFVFAAIVQQGSVFSQNTYKWVTTGGIQDLFQHPLVVKGLSLLNNYLPLIRLSLMPSLRKLPSLLPLLAPTLSQSVRKYWATQRTF
ncbi:hypothetical protein ACOMICROBIO_EPCKBFOG_02321 [Vibrio sp. B1FLJ16]|nr:hypothetical protein ACOMICROBIO_EPCKBFOG_02321 [Vibrio sp. B1FLJ16]CAE6915921.1 hypothetical protein ACOMICROBIO_EPCKBFOG_02321 [Vibrio sp. B1FLJ16]